MIGDAAAGKTALAQCFVSGPSGFPNNYVMTPGCSISQKTITVPDQDVQVELQILDTGGQTIYSDIAKEMVSSTQVQRANAAIFVFDVTSPESLNSMNFWLSYVREAIKDRPFVGVLVAAKSDLNERANFDVNERIKFCRDNAFEYVETSAVRLSQCKMIEVETPFTIVASQFAQSYAEKINQLSRLA